MDQKYLEILNLRKNQEVLGIRKCNEETNKYGLTLSEKQIQNLLTYKMSMLRETGRLEFKGGIVEKIIKEFCDSQYIDQGNYESTLCELIEIFYEYKNETMDFVSDDELIKFMKESYENIAHGDIEYLAGTIMSKMKENVLNGKPLDYLDEEEE